MKKDHFCYYEKDTKEVYAAVIQALKDAFNMESQGTPYHTVSFGLHLSMKYNITGGECNIHLMPVENGTALCMHYTIAQLGMANTKKHFSDFNKAMEKILGVKAKDYKQGKKQGVEAFLQGKELQEEDLENVTGGCSSDYIGRIKK